MHSCITAILKHMCVYSCRGVCSQASAMYAATTEHSAEHRNKNTVEYNKNEINLKNSK